LRVRLDASGDGQYCTGGESAVPGGTWEGTIEGDRLQITIHLQDGGLVFEGTVPAGTTDQQPTEGGEQPAEPTTDPLSAALAEVFAGAGDLFARSDAYARERTGGKTVNESSNAEFLRVMNAAFEDSIDLPADPTGLQVRAGAGMSLVAQYASATDNEGLLLFPTVNKALPILARLAQKIADDDDPQATLVFGRFFSILMNLDIAAGKST
jgi:hypothetical protein